MEKKKLLAEKPLTIYAYDIDAMGIVSNIVYVRWFEDLRTSFLSETYSIADMLKLQISPILIKTEVDYKIPLTIFDQPIGRCWLISIGNSSWELAFEISVNEVVHCSGRQKGCFYDLQKKKVTRVPAPLQTTLAEEMEA
jgi:acyl-CoA thioester hydrolase